MNLKTIIENSETKLGRRFDLLIQILIIISLISFSTETIPTLSNEVKAFLSIIELVCVVIFSIEYILRIMVASNRLKFIFSFYGLVDLLAILPFYILSGVDLRSVRVFRLFRLFRIFKVLRYSNALQKFKLAYNSIKEELNLFLLATLFMLYISAVGIYYFESSAQPEKFTSIFECL